MIRYLRGHESADAEAITPPGSVAAGEAPLAVATSIHVGAMTYEVRALLGSWPTGEPDPAGPGGLLGMPVVVLPDGADQELARAGAIRAGGRPTVLAVRGDARRLGIQLLVARSSGVDVTLIQEGGAPHLRLARVLGGRPLPVLPLEHPDEIADLLDASGVDLDVPIPTVPGEAEPRILGGPAGQLDPRHHPVQVDPRPAFAELGRAVSGATRLELATAAAGVLAGRLASASRRWQEG